MKTIKMLAKQIREELKDAEKYAKDALEYKNECAIAADTFYRLSGEELDHANLLYDAASRVMEKMGRETVMQEFLHEVWEWEHEHMLDEAKEIRHMLEMYKK